VLITKALIEIPPKFKDKPPVNPEARSEYGEVRSESGETDCSFLSSQPSFLSSTEIRRKDALPGTDCMAEGDGSGARTISSSTEVAQGGNLRNAFSDHTIDRLDSSQYRRGMDAGIREGESTVFSDRPGVVSGDGNLTNSMRESGVVSQGSNPNIKGVARRGEPNSNNDAPQDEERGERREKRVMHEERVAQFSLLTSHSYKGAQGLAEDVRYYGRWMRSEALKRIGYLYPKVEVKGEESNEKREESNTSLSPYSSILSPSHPSLLTVIAWTEISRLALDIRRSTPLQTSLDL
jgi:putative DNA methylase